MALKAGIFRAYRAGHFLLEAKRRVKRQRGAWLPWLAANVSFSVRTAQTYMQVTRKTNTQRAAHRGVESIRGMLQLLGHRQPARVEADYQCPDCGYAWIGRPKPKSVAPVTPADRIEQEPQPA